MAGLVFCGENRARALDGIVGAYREVAASARARLDRRDAPAPAHRVVLIHAERGLGKTRLAHEFYAWLSREDDPDGYWPDELAMLREKDPQFTLTARPRFLWWELEIPDGTRAGNTVLNALGDLLPHLTTVRLAARRRETVRDIAGELADLAVELGISHGGEILGEALTGILGPVKTFGMSAWKIGRIVRGAVQEERDPFGHAEAHVESLSDALIADLARLFDPRSRNYAGAPLVLFVDDAQFADQADAVDHFLAELIGRATRDGWPLFLLLTHWSRDRTEWVDGDGKRHPPSHVARIIEHARYGLELDPGPFGGGGGGTLRQGSFLEIDLGEPVDDLRPALLGDYPGLSSVAVEQILHLVGGNPRKLEQIAAKMRRKSVWFQDRKRTADLTEDGLAQVLALSELGIDEIALDRFQEAPEDVRKSLMLAGLCGHQFLVELVERLAQARLGAPAQEGLEDGERTFRMVRDVLDRSRDAPSAFAERLFHQASRSYRTNGQASEDLAGWPDDAELDAALDATLGELVRRPESFPGLRPGERAHALGLAADRFLAAENALAWLALARLVAVEEARSNYEGAASAARRFALRPPGTSLAPIDSGLLDAVAGTLARSGLRDAAEMVWRGLHERLAEQAALDPGNAGWQRDLSVSHDRIGDAEMARGGRDAAIAAYRAGLAIRARLAALDPGNAGWQRDLSVSQLKIGDAEMARGGRDAAIAAYRAGLAIAERLAALDPGNVEWQRDLIVSHVKHAEAGDTPKQHYVAALEIARRLHDGGLLAPADAWMIPELERRVASSK